jgi:hypothetical protein
VARGIVESNWCPLICLFSRYGLVAPDALAAVMMQPNPKTGQPAIPK